MASRPVEMGAMGRHVAESIARVRREQGLEQRELAALVAAAGRQLSASVLSKIEACARRVDVDDLVAIAAALEVPVALLLAIAVNEPTLPDPAEPRGVEPTVREDVEQLGDLVDVEPTLAEMAYTLAREIDAGGGEDGRQLPALSRELRAVLAQLMETRASDPEDDDGLDDLADPG